VQSSGGFDSLTAKYGLTEFLGEWPAAEVLHIGDHDPSGTLRLACRRRSCELRPCRSELYRPGRDTRANRLPRPADGIAEIDPTDLRGFDGEQTVQAEAIPPDVLTEMSKEQSMIASTKQRGNGCLLPKSTPVLLGRFRDI
jgi:hypothetical protein